MLLICSFIDYMFFSVLCHIDITNIDYSVIFASLMQLKQTIFIIFKRKATAKIKKILYLCNRNIELMFIKR